jgi:hypothetical protein
MGAPAKLFEVNDGVPYYSRATITRANHDKLITYSFIPYPEAIRNGHLKAIYVVFESAESEIEAIYRPSLEHEGVKVVFKREKATVDIPSSKTLED